MVKSNLFGTFLREKRSEKGISLRELAKKVNLSHSYLSNLENGKKPPPSNKLLIDISKALSLDKESQRLLFDIAVEVKDFQHTEYTVPADISKYLYETVAAKGLIREADEQGCSNDFWDEILRQLKDKNISQ